MLSNILVLYIHGKGGTAQEAEHWFHTVEQMAFLDQWIVEKQQRIQHEA